MDLKFAILTKGIHKTSNLDEKSTIHVRSIIAQSFSEQIFI